MIKAIVFDMDGVLIEAKDWHYNALNNALKLFGYEISRFDHLATYDGLPTSRKLEMLSVERGLPRELHDFISEMKQMYTMEIVYTKCKPRFVHENALSTLKSMGYILGVASNSTRATVEVMMEKAHLKDYLDFQLSADDVIQPKPAPDIYLKAIKKLGVLPKECLVVEDNENGIKAARASGAHVMIVIDINEVNIENICTRIRQAESEMAE